MKYFLKKNTRFSNLNKQIALCKIPKILQHSATCDSGSIHVEFSINPKGQLYQNQIFTSQYILNIGLEWTHVSNLTPTCHHYSYDTNIVRQIEQA